MASILIVEDEDAIRSAIRQSLQLDGHTVCDAPTVAAAWKLVQESELDLVLTDISLPDDSGLELVSRLRGDGFDGPIVVITAYGTIDNAVEAMKRGANEYLQKPVSLEELGIVIQRSIEQRRVQTKLRLYERLERVHSESVDLLGKSDCWNRAVALAERFAALAVPRKAGEGDLPTILLLGETGSGKGLLAKRIHDYAVASEPNDAAPFVHVNCAVLPPSLIEAELFGHERGAFTDAKTARKGLFEMAEGGTIFLDEIGELPLEMQAKLLTVVESGRFRRIGGSAELLARLRIITATNQDLDTRVERGDFRRDLFYRLNTFTVRIPPLRERGDDVFLITSSLLDRHADRNLVLDDGARQALLDHDWPGNVRELINVMKRASLLCETSTIGVDDLMLPANTNLTEKRNHHAANGIVGDNGTIPTIHAVERILILKAMQIANGNVSMAAKLIGLNRGALRYRLERFGLTHEFEESRSG